MTVKTIKSLANQTLYDVALAYYGTAEAVGELLELNPSLANDPGALGALGIGNMDDYYLDVALLAGQDIDIDTDSALRLPNVLRAIENTEITTFTLP